MKIGRQKEVDMKSRFFTKFMKSSGEEIAYCRMKFLVKEVCKRTGADLKGTLETIRIYENKDSDNYFKRNYFLEYPELIRLFNK